MPRETEHTTTICNKRIRSSGKSQDLCTEFGGSTGGRMPFIVDFRIEAAQRLGISKEDSNQSGRGPDAPNATPCAPACPVTLVAASSNLNPFKYKLAEPRDQSPLVQKPASKRAHSSRNSCSVESNAFKRSLSTSIVPITRSPAMSRTGTMISARVSSKAVR